MAAFPGWARRLLPMIRHVHEFISRFPDAPDCAQRTLSNDDEKPCSVNTRSESTRLLVSRSRYFLPRQQISVIHQGGESFHSSSEVSLAIVSSPSAGDSDGASIMLGENGREWPLSGFEDRARGALVTRMIRDLFDSPP